MTLNWNGPKHLNRLTVPTAAAKRQQAEVVPFTARQEPPATAAHIIQLPPLTPENKLANVERWLDNVEHNLVRRSATRHDNIRAALRDLVPVADHLDAITLDVAGEMESAPSAYTRCMKEHAGFAARHWKRAWTREAEAEIRHAVADGWRAVTALRAILRERGG